MTSRDFCYWLQGFFELREANGLPTDSPLAPKQVQCIRNHLHMVFKHEIDPSHGDAAHQEVLQKAHGGKPSTASPRPRSRSSTTGSGYHKPPKAMC